MVIIKRCCNCLLATDLDRSGEEIEQRSLDVLRAVTKPVSIPFAIKVGPYFSAFGRMTRRLVSRQSHEPVWSQEANSVRPMKPVVDFAYGVQPCGFTLLFIRSVLRQKSMLVVKSMATLRSD